MVLIFSLTHKSIPWRKCWGITCHPWGGRPATLTRPRDKALLTGGGSDYQSSQGRGAGAPETAQFIPECS